MGYVRDVGNFFSSMFAEHVARRRRLREIFGDRGQSLVELLVIGGLIVGSIGLFARPWMASAAPWGFALPPVFLIGFVLIELRRQRALKRGAEEDKVRVGYDWMVALWALTSTLAGAAAFALAWAAEPPPPPPPPETPVEEWSPPEGAVDSTLVRPPAEE